MFKTKHIILTFMTLCLSAMLFAAEPAKDEKAKAEISQDTVIKNFIAWDKNLQTLDTFYTQETSFEGTLISKSFGHLLKTGQNLRLETLEDGKITQYALTDKKIINIFDDKGNLITQMLWQDWQETQQNKSLFDFGNYAKILENHKVISFDVTQQGYLLTLIPKKGDVYNLTFLLDKKILFPKEINLLSEGVNSKTALQKIKINKNINKENLK